MHGFINFKIIIIIEGIQIYSKSRSDDLGSKLIIYASSSISPEIFISSNSKNIGKGVRLAKRDFCGYICPVVVAKSRSPNLLVNFFRTQILRNTRVQNLG